MPLPALPPAYHLIALDPEVAAFERAVRAAPRGTEDSTIYWSARNDLLDMALVLEPETAAPPVLDAVYLLAVAACEALAALVPPAVPIACAWPGDLLLAGARVGGIRAAVAPTADPAAPPPWLVLGLCVQLAAMPSDLPDRTALASHGAPEVTAAGLLGAVSDEVLHWAGRRRVDGPSGIYTAWNRRCFRYGETGALTLDGQRIAGPIAGLDTEGRFVIGRHRLSLADASALLA